MGGRRHSARAGQAGADVCPECGADAGDNWFDRSLCPEPCGWMHTRCAACGHPYEECVLDRDVDEDAG